jgi:hypothetical protein
MSFSKIPYSVKCPAAFLIFFRPSYSSPSFESNPRQVIHGILEPQSQDLDRSRVQREIDRHRGPSLSPAGYRVGPYPGIPVLDAKRNGLLFGRLLDEQDEIFCRDPRRH